MASPSEQIPRVQVGGVSLVSAEYANQLIDRLNAIGGATLAPIANVGSFKFAGGSFILDLSVLDRRVFACENVSAQHNALGIRNSTTLIRSNAELAVFRRINTQLVLDLSPTQNRLLVLESANAIISPSGTPAPATNIATFQHTPFANFYLDFTALHNRLVNIEASLANVSANTVSNINTRLTNLIASINNANISANCNANSNAITVTLTFPNVPGV